MPSTPLRTSATALFMALLISPLLAAKPARPVAWTRAGDRYGTAVTVDGDRVSINYNNGPSPAASASYGRIRRADVDLSVGVRLWYAGKNRRAGLSYRMTDARGLINAPGYHVLLGEQGVFLTYGDKPLVSKAMALANKTWHTLRVLAAGSSHKVFVNGKLVIDTIDATSLTEGFVGVTQLYQSVRFRGFALAAPSAAPPATGAARAWPAGEAFPLVLYSCQDAVEQAEVRRSGWNIAHTYGKQSPFLGVCAQSGIDALVRLPGKDQPVPEAEAAKVLQTLGGERTLWWDLPEERRWWRKGEMELITTWSATIRKYDPKKRPAYMYIPGHYKAASIAKYVPYLDIVGAGTYTTYARMPYAWVRWRMEETIRGIKLAGATVGSDYLKGQKLPIATLGLFHGKPKPGRMPPRIRTPQGATHDFWQSIASGARGILIFSYYHRKDVPEHRAVWAAYNKAAAQLTGPEGLDRVVQTGKPVRAIRAKALAGALKTVEFRPHAPKKSPSPALRFPSINLLALRFEGALYIIAVNSAESWVSAEITGLPAKAKEAALLFQDKAVAIEKGVLTLDFPALGVHILKIKD